MPEGKESSQSLGGKRFKRVIENFTCFNCKTRAEGKGYTDHCPNCLWSLHVDNNPGDRASKCHGKMKPVGVLYDKGNYVISYLCLSCGSKKRFKAAQNDNSELLLSLLKAA
jgi:rubredoxin